MLNVQPLLKSEDLLLLELNVLLNSMLKPGDLTFISVYVRE
jgi:hypothetical protein